MEQKNASRSQSRGRRSRRGAQMPNLPIRFSAAMETIGRYLKADTFELTLLKRAGQQVIGEARHGRRSMIVTFRNWMERGVPTALVVAGFARVRL